MVESGIPFALGAFLSSMDRAGRRAELLSIVSHGIAPDAKGISMKTEF